MRTLEFKYSILLSVIMVLQPTSDLWATPVQEKVATSSISGVVSMSGTVAAGVGVLLSDATPGPGGGGRPAARTVSDKKGRFNFDGLERGSYYVEAYVPGAAVQVSAGRRATLVTVGAGESVDGITIDLQPGGVITGKVVDIEQRPVAGEAIHLYSEEKVSETATQMRRMQSDTTTDDRGVYRIYGLAPGRYAVGGGNLKSGYADGLYAMAFFGGGDSPGEARRLTVESGSEVRDVDLVLVRGESGFSVSGRVVDAATRKPVRDARIFAGPIQNGRMMAVSGGGAVSEDGEFTLAGRARGSWGIVAMPGSPDAESYYSETVEVAVEDRDVSGVVVQMRQAASITGVVVGLETEPGLDLSAIRSDAISLNRRPEPGDTGRFPFSSAQIRVKPDLTFRATGLRTGEYTLAFNPYSQSKGMYVARVEIAGSPVDGPIRIAEAVEIPDVRVVIGRAEALLRGVVSVKNGTLQFERVGVRLTSASGQTIGGFARVDAKGTFQMESVPPGEYRASAIALGADAPIESKPVTVTIPKSGTVEVTIELDLGPRSTNPEEAP